MKAFNGASINRICRKSQPLRDYFKKRPECTSSFNYLNFCRDLLQSAGLYIAAPIRHEYLHALRLFNEYLK